MKYDATIVGGGLVGLTIGLLLSRIGMRVAIIEQEAPCLQWEPNSVDLRCLAINRFSSEILKKINIWDTLSPLQLSPYTVMEVWEEATQAKITFNALDIYESELGHIIENRMLIKALWEAVSQDSGITLYVPAIIDTIRTSPQNTLLTLESGQSIEAPLLIGADGARSIVRTYCNIAVNEQDYEQMALVTTAQVELPHAKTARQRFLNDGILAFLPLVRPHLCSIVWSTSIENAEHLLQMEGDEFCQTLGQRFEFCLGRIEKISQRMCFHLKSLQATTYIGERIALMGDSAHVVHPFAGQGANLGFYDVGILADCIQKFYNQGSDIGSHLLLREYERKCKSHNTTVMRTLQLFKEIFAAKNPLLVQLRSLGILGIDKSLFLKKQIMLKAMGLSEHANFF